MIYLYIQKAACLQRSTFRETKNIKIKGFLQVRPGGAPIVAPQVAPPAVERGSFAAICIPLVAGTLSPPRGVLAPKFDPNEGRGHAMPFMSAGMYTTAWREGQPGVRKLPLLYIQQVS